MVTCPLAPLKNGVKMMIARKSIGITLIISLLMLFGCGKREAEEPSTGEVLIKGDAQATSNDALLWKFKTEDIPQYSFTKALLGWWSIPIYSWASRLPKRVCEKHVMYRRWFRYASHSTQALFATESLRQMDGHGSIAGRRAAATMSRHTGCASCVASSLRLDTSHTRSKS